MPVIDRAGIFERLKHALQLLACPSEIQLRLLPDFVCKGDELALDFDNWRGAAVGNFRSEMTPEQLSSLDALDVSFVELTKAGPEDWTDDSMRMSDKWSKIRHLAQMALRSFGWPEEMLPSYSHEFVRAKSPATRVK